MKSLFKNITVIELSSVLAGPATGLFFKELGAQVIKIENKKTGGDITRQWRLPEEKNAKQDSAYYTSVNYGKKKVFLDLTKPIDQQKALRLISKADIVISNFKKGDDKKLGVDYSSVKKHNPNIIYAHLSGYGKNSNRPAFDLVLQAEAGYLSMTGSTKNQLAKMPVAFIDILAAHQLKEAILIALWNRSQNKKGAYIHVSLFDAAISSLANQASNFLIANHIPQPLGLLHPNIAPYGECFKTKDNKLFLLAIGTDKQFKLLCELLHNEKLATDKRFSTNQERVKNRKQLHKFLKAYFLTQNASTLNVTFQKNGIPAGIIKNLKEVFNDKSAIRLIKNKMLVKSIAFKIA